MGFDWRDIRRKMDVYSADGFYLGTVLRVNSADPAEWPETQPVAGHASGGAIGERLGPAPTQTIGNPGPLNQIAGRRYSSLPDGSRRLHNGSIVVGKLWGLTGRRTIPVSAIQTVSMERISLRFTLEQLKAINRASGSVQT